MTPSRMGDASLTFDTTTDRWPLIRYLIDDPVYRQRYTDAVAEFVTDVFDEDVLFPRIEELHALAGPSLAREAAPYTQLRDYASYETALIDANGLFAHIEARRAAALQLLDQGWP